MEHLYFSQEGDFWIEKLRPEHIKDHRIIGKPLTLDRVLIAASKVSLTYYPHSNGLNLNSHIIWELLAMWNLTKPTLEDQSEKTQRVINKLFII
jgi:hypothetical protein